MSVTELESAPATGRYRPGSFGRLELTLDRVEVDGIDQLLPAAEPVVHGADADPGPPGNLLERARKTCSRKTSRATARMRSRFPGRIGPAGSAPPRRVFERSSSWPMSSTL